MLKIITEKKQIQAYQTQLEFILTENLYSEDEFTVAYHGRSWQKTLKFNESVNYVLIMHLLKTRLADPI